MDIEKGSSDSSNERESAQNSKRLMLLAKFGFAITFVSLVVGSMALIKINKISQDEKIIMDDPVTIQTIPPTNKIIDSNMLEGSTTLYKIKQRGELNCGITITPGFGIITESENGEKLYSGFDVDLCRSVAAAIFSELENPDSFINYTTLTGTERFKCLQDMEVDMLARITTLTMDRDVWVPEANSGFSFSVPYIFDGHRFAGMPEFVECANDLDIISGNCASLQVCVNDGTTTLEQLKTFLPVENISIRVSNLEAQMGLVDGSCNVIFAGSNCELVIKSIQITNFINCEL